MGASVNEDFAAATPHAESRWRFIVPVSARTVSGATDEILDVLQSSVRCCAPLIDFRAAEITVNCYDSDLTLSQIASSDRSPPVSDSLRFDTEADFPGVPSRRIADRIGELCESSVHEFVRTLSLGTAATLLTLSDFEGYVDKADTEYYRTVKSGTVTSEPPYADPLRFEVSNREAPVAGDIETARVFEMTLTSATDIWFGDTDVAATNRRRLADVLTCLHEELPEGDRFFGGERYGEHGLAEVDRLHSLVPWADFE